MAPGAPHLEVVLPKQIGVRIFKLRGQRLSVVGVVVPEGGDGAVDGAHLVLVIHDRVPHLCQALPDGLQLGAVLHGDFGEPDEQVGLQLVQHCVVVHAVSHSHAVVLVHLGHGEVGRELRLVELVELVPEHVRERGYLSGRARAEGHGAGFLHVALLPQEPGVARAVALLEAELRHVHALPEVALNLVEEAGPGLVRQRQAGLLSRAAELRDVCGRHLAGLLEPRDFLHLVLNVQQCVRQPRGTDAPVPDVVALLLLQRARHPVHLDAIRQRRRKRRKCAVRVLLKAQRRRHNGVIHIDAVGFAARGQHAAIRDFHVGGAPAGGQAERARGGQWSRSHFREPDIAEVGELGLHLVLWHHRHQTVVVRLEAGARRAERHARPGPGLHGGLPRHAPRRGGGEHARHAAGRQVDVHRHACDPGLHCPDRGIVLVLQPGGNLVPGQTARGAVGGGGHQAVVGLLEHVDEPRGPGVRLVDAGEELPAELVHENPGHLLRHQGVVGVHAVEVLVVGGEFQKHGAGGPPPDQGRVQVLLRKVLVRADRVRAVVVRDVPVGRAMRSSDDEHASCLRLRIPSLPILKAALAHLNAMSRGRSA